MRSQPSIPLHAWWLMPNWPSRGVQTWCHWCCPEGPAGCEWQHKVPWNCALHQPFTPFSQDWLQRILLHACARVQCNLCKDSRLCCESPSLFSCHLFLKYIFTKTKTQTNRVRSTWEPYARTPLTYWEQAHAHPTNQLFPLAWSLTHPGFREACSWTMLLHASTQ